MKSELKVIAKEIAKLERAIEKYPDKASQYLAQMEVLTYQLTPLDMLKIDEYIARKGLLTK